VGSCPHQKPHVERRSDGLSRDQGNDSLCNRQSSPGRHIGLTEGELMGRGVTPQNFEF
jgi:hypothetical protein